MNLGMSAVGFGSPFAEAGALGSAGGKGIRAYHGSPYDFERFDLSKIGSGEGAQAYGHGLYFAESEPVAADYRRRLAPGTDINVRPDEQAIATHSGTWDALVQQRRTLTDANPRANTDDIDRAMDIVHKQMVDDTIARNPQLLKGRMYEVTINGHPDEFLDWDKPLSEQPPIVQDLARNADLSHLKPGNRTRRQIEMWREGQITNPADEPTGNVLHNALTDYGTNPQNNAALTETLRDAGIKGIKYLDQGSRNVAPSKFVANEPYSSSNPQHLASQYLDMFGKRGKSPGQVANILRSENPGSSLHEQAADLIETGADVPKMEHRDMSTRNYVVFDDKLIDIVKKYGLAGLLGAGAYHFKTSGNHDNPHVPGPI
jgi:hypothetical protein